VQFAEVSKLKNLIENFRGFWRSLVVVGRNFEGLWVDAAVVACGVETLKDYGGEERLWFIDCGYGTWEYKMERDNKSIRRKRKKLIVKRDSLLKEIKI
jgi:hypothetical protein